MTDAIVPSLKGGGIVATKDLQGYEGVDLGDMNVRPPSIRIVQAMRPDAIRGRRDLAEGDLYDTLSYEQLSNPIPVIPFAAWNDYTEWKKGPNGKALSGSEAEVIYQTTNGADPKILGRTRGSKHGGVWTPPEVVKTLRMLAIRPGVSVPCIVSFAKTSLSCGEQIIMAAMSKGKNLYDQAILLGTKGVPHPETGGMFYVFTSRPHPEEVPESEKAVAKDWIERYRGLRTEVQGEAE